MHLFTAESLADYLVRTGRASAADALRVQQLAGGISNAVYRVEPKAAGETRGRSAGGQPAFVVKQAREKLRTADPWYCTVERIWREVEVLETCAAILAAAAAQSGEAVDVVPCVPQLLFIDREEYLFAMTAAPAEHQTWKERLLGGHAETACAVASGRLLGRLHAGTWHDPRLEEILRDRQLFRELRLNPYYRATARACPAAALYFEQVSELAERELHCLVHADFSPKNLLIWPGRMMLVDFETGHYGDPAFDLGFFLTHLVLKAHWAAGRYRDYLELIRAFWSAYCGAVAGRIPADDLAALERRAVLHLAGCSWARLDGTSKIDYLAEESLRTQVRDAARAIFASRPASLVEVMSMYAERLKAGADE